MKRQTVYIEALGLVEGHFSGIGQYILGVLRGLDSILEAEKLAGKETPRIKVVIPFNSYHKFKAFKFKHLEAVRFPMTFRLMAALWHRGKMPPIDLWCGRGYYIFTRFATMPLVFSKSAVVIYDLSFELHKQYSDDGNARFLTRATRHSLKQVDTVFTISKNAKHEIESIYGVQPKRVKLAYPAADQRYFYRRSRAEIENVKRKYGIEGNYILALSNLEPRKNLETLVDAYCALPSSYRKNTSLLLVGVSGWKTDKLFQKIIEKVNDGYQIIRPSKYVHDDDKPAILSGAQMLVYPSHYEGFGMPPVEALACGTPVIAANNSSLPEAVGNAGVLLPCDDAGKLADAIRSTLDDIPTVTKKTETAGPAQAARFSWEEAAKVYWDDIMEQMV